MKKKFNLVSVSIVIVMCLLFVAACNFNNNSSTDPTASDASQSAPASDASQSAPASDSAQGNTINWTFDAESGKLSIFGKGEMTDYSETNSPWQEYKASIKSVEISDGVTNIGANAFSGCTLLTSVTIADSVTSIGGSAFGGCTALTSVTIGSGVVMIGAYAFSGCTALTSITFSDTTTWYRTTSSSYDGGTQMNVSNATTNATYFKDTYVNDYWDKE